MIKWYQIWQLSDNSIDVYVTLIILNNVIYYHKIDHAEKSYI